MSKRDLIYKVVDAYRLRNSTPEFEEFGLYAIHSDFPLQILPNEIWIDRNLSEAEQNLYKSMALKRIGLEGRGMKPDKAYEYVLNLEEQERRKHEQQFEESQRSHPELKILKLKDIGKPGDKFKVYVVNGEWVRNLYKTDFVEGGNGEVYPWVPKDEIWVEADVEESERKYVILHEYVELHLMRDQGLTYDQAHLRASELEFKSRKKV